MHGINLARDVPYSDLLLDRRGLSRERCSIYLLALTVIESSYFATAYSPPSRIIRVYREQINVAFSRFPRAIATPILILVECCFIYNIVALRIQIAYLRQRLHQFPTRPRLGWDLAGNHERKD